MEKEKRIFDDYIDDELKNIEEEDILRRGVDILRVIRNVDDPYQKFPVFGNERFHLRKIEENDVKDLLLDKVNINQNNKINYTNYVPQNLIIKKETEVSYKLKYSISPGFTLS